MEWDPRQHRDPELGGELVRGIPHERAVDHVLDHAEQRRLPVVGGTKCAAHRVARLGCRDGHCEHGGSCDLFELYRAFEKSDVRNTWRADSGAVYDLGYADVHLQANIKGGVLVVATFNSIKDDSGRSSYFMREFYYRA